jgi:hypothetical protein
VCLVGKRVSGFPATRASGPRAACAAERGGLFCTGTFPTHTPPKTLAPNPWFLTLPLPHTVPPYFPQRENKNENALPVSIQS